MSSSPVTLIGNLTGDPDLKFLANGTPKLEFSVACNEYWTDKDGERQEKTSFFNIVVWRNLAEDAAAVLEKGIGVVISGRLEQQSWEDKESGEKRSRVQVLADRIGVNVGSISAITRKSRNEDGGARKSAPAKKVAQKVAEDDEPF